MFACVILLTDVHSSFSNLFIKILKRSSFLLLFYNFDYSKELDLPTSLTWLPAMKYWLSKMPLRCLNCTARDAWVDSCDTKKRLDFLTPTKETVVFIRFSLSAVVHVANGPLKRSRLNHIFPPVQKGFLRDIWCFRVFFIYLALQNLRKNTTLFFLTETISVKVF